MKAFKVVTDPEAFKLLADETRRKIIYILRAKEMTVSQLADDLEKTPQAIYHQIAKLRKTGLVEISREERIGHFIESYYRAAAEVFYFSHGEGKQGVEAARKEIADAFTYLPKLGIRLKGDQETVKKLADSWLDFCACGQDPRLEEKISSLEDIDFFAKQNLMEMLHYHNVSDKDFEKRLEMLRKFRDLLRSATAK